MRPMRLALAQAAWPGARPALMATYEAMARSAAADGAHILCLPEFSLSPYFASFLDADGFRWSEALPNGPSVQFFGQLARTHRLAVVGSLYERAEGRYFDTATLHAPDGRLAGYTRKVHIPHGPGYHEDHFFEGGHEFPVHTLDGVRLALPTCYDQWFPELSRIYALRGAELIIYPTAIGSEPTAPELDTQPAWQMVMRGQAIANGVFIAAVNRVGQEGVTFYGSSFVCDPMGHVLAAAGRDQVELVLADLDPATLVKWRELFPLLRQRRPQIYGSWLTEIGQAGAEP